MSEDHGYYQYEVQLISAKITKPEQFKDSEFFVSNDISDYKKKHKIISKEKYDVIMSLLEGGL